MVPMQGIWTGIEANWTHMAGRKTPNQRADPVQPADTAARPASRARRQPSLRNDTRLRERLHTLSQSRWQTIGAVPLGLRARHMAEELRSVFDMDACVMRLLEGEDLVLVACAGLPDGSCPERLQVGCGIAREILQRRSPLFILDIMSHPVLASERSHPPDPRAFVSYAGAPMLAGDRVIGLLGLFSRTRRDDLTQADLDCIQLMANNVSLALANDQLYGRLMNQHLALEKEAYTRSQAEEEVRQLRDDLARRSRVSAMGELTATIAHELNQPLGAIMTNMQACQRLLNRTDPDLEEVRAALAEMIQDGSRAREVIGRVREFLRRGEAEKTRVDLNAVVRSVVPMLRARLSKDHVELMLDLKPDLPPILGGVGQLQQVVFNLIINAADAVAAREPASRKVKVTSGLLLDGMVSIAVQDSGVGVPAENLNRLFDPFFTTKPDGTGMGLPICRSIIESLGGRLWAESDGRSGSVFQFAIPATGDFPR